MRKIYTGTVEYLVVRVRANEDLDEQTVEFSFDKDTWYAAEWDGDPGMTRLAKLLVGEEEVVELPGKGTAELFVRVGDSPEAEIFSVGQLAIK